VSTDGFNRYLSRIEVVQLRDPFRFLPFSQHAISQQGMRTKSMDLPANFHFFGDMGLALTYA